MPGIALVAARGSQSLQGDGPLLIAAFQALGFGAEIVGWGGGTDWSGFDAALIRNTWDYVLDRDGFLGWAAEVAAATRLANPLEVLVWNTDKRYLRDLEVAGIPIVPTHWVEPGEQAPLVDWDTFVVKPAVSAGARLSARYRRGDDIAAHVRRIHDIGAAAMVQPYLRSVDAEGEVGTYVFGGEASHAIRKRQALRDGGAPLDDLSAGEAQSVEPTELDPHLVGFARRVLAAAPHLVYARVDTALGSDGEPLLLELEATEPSLFLDLVPVAADHFAGAVVDWLAGAAVPPPTPR